MKNNVIITKEEVLEVKDNVLNLEIKSKAIELNIKGNVLINRIETTTIINDQIIINLAANSQLLFNIFLIDPRLQTNIIIRQKENSKVTINYAFLTNIESNLNVDLNMDSHNNDAVININAVTKGEGQTKIRITGTIADKTSNNNLTENIKCLVLNNKTNQIIPNLIVKSNEATVNHNATISPIADDDIFYLTSKGLDIKEASTIITNGFLISKLVIDEDTKKLIKTLLKED